MISKRVLFLAAALIVVSSTCVMADTSVRLEDHFAVSQLDITSPGYLQLTQSNSWGIVTGTALHPTPTDSATIFGYVLAGANVIDNFPYWNGVGGINSYAAANDPNQITAVGFLSGQEQADWGIIESGTFHGFTIGTSDSLIAITVLGDANLDGKVDVSDYNLIDYGYQNGYTEGYTGGWKLGDFNYDGFIDVSDYNLIDYVYQNFTVPGPVVNSAPVSIVPEPSTLVLLVSALIAAFAYLRKR